MSQYPGYESQPPTFVPAQTSSMAVVSLVCGIATWVILPLIGAIIAVITGHMARREIRDSMGRLTGDGLATAGLVLGYLQLGLGLVAACLMVGLLVFTASTGPGSAG